MTDKTAAELRKEAAEAETRQIEQKSDDRGYIVRGSD